MFLIDSPGHQNNRFTEGSKAPPTPSTRVSAAFLNAVMLELVNVILDAGLTLDKADNTQLKQALLAKFATALELDAHTGAASPHSGHATTAALTAHTGSAAPHAGHETPAGAQAKVDAAAIGVDQTWQNVTGSRAKDAEYTNATGRPIQIIVRCTTSSYGPTELRVGAISADTVIDYTSTADNARPSYDSVQAIIPAGWKYKITGNTTINTWFELR